MYAYFVSISTEFIYIKERSSVRALRRIISPPTSIPTVLCDSFCVSHAPTGAATNPPMTIGSTMDKFTVGIVRKKVREIENETKNSAKFTEPITCCGCAFRRMSVGVAIGHHPPPPIASTNDATKPSGIR